MHEMNKQMPGRQEYVHKVDHVGNALEVVKLNAWYGKTMAVNNISMSIWLQIHYCFNRSFGLREVHFYSLFEPDA